jgi:hypothetical protein
MLATATDAPVQAGVNVAVLNGLKPIPAASWDALLRPGQAGVRHGYLSAWEQATLSGLRSRPLVARDGTDGSLLAAAPGYFYDLDPSCLKRPRPPAIVERLRRIHERLLMMRIFEVGCPVALSDPILHRRDLSASEAARILLPQALEEAERGRAQVVVVQDFPSRDGECAEVLSELGFAPVPVLPTVVLELGFDDFDDYLGAMRAQYRRRARRVLAQSSHLRVERRRDFAELVPELGRLARQVYDRADEIRREILTERYYRAAAQRDDLSLLVLRRPDDSVACFALLLDDRPWLHFLNCGFEASAGRDEGAYFRLLYEIVRTAIDDRYERVNFGLTTLPPKLDTGGIPVALVAWMRYHRPLIQGLCSAAGQRLLYARQLEPRHVFKDPARRELSSAAVDPCGCVGDYRAELAQLRR